MRAYLKLRSSCPRLKVDWRRVVNRDGWGPRERRPRGRVVLSESNDDPFLVGSRLGHALLDKIDAGDRLDGAGVVLEDLLLGLPEVEPCAFHLVV